jgi:hypothetical protein
MKLENIEEIYDEHRKIIITALIVLIAIIFFVASDTGSQALGYVVKQFTLS